jgi:hypothetical protein
MRDQSRHSAKRAKGRCIPPGIIGLLHDFATPYPAGGGAEKLIFDKRARRRLESNVGYLMYRRIEDLLDAYVVRAADGTIITTGWLTKHVLR